MAGLRAGFMIGHPTQISKLQPDYFQNSRIGVNNLSRAAALASLTDEEHQTSGKQKNEAARNYTECEMKQFCPALKFITK